MKFKFFFCSYCRVRARNRLAGKSKLLILFLLALSALLSGCTGTTNDSIGESAVAYFIDIPDITEEEIDAIEALKAYNETFTYGSLLGMEMFIQPDGSYEGFSIGFCELLTELFGIPFEVVLFNGWDELKAEHDTMKIDFTGNLTPTLERMEIYQMSNPITERSLRLFTRRGSKEITKETDIDNLKIGFLSDTITASYIMKTYPVFFEIEDVASYEAAANMLLSGGIDAFVDEEDADMFFLDYNEIESKKFFSLVYSPISMTSANKELAPIISALNKYLVAGGMDNLLALHTKGERDYAKYKLNRLLTDEEKAYIADTYANPVKLALENDNYPLSFYNKSTKTYQGIAIDVLDEISEISGIQFEAVTSETMNWTELLNALETGKASIITQLLFTDDRKDRFIWSDTAYSSSYYALLSRVDYPDLSNFQVSRAKVGVFTNSAHEYVFYEWFPEYPNAQQYETLSDGINALSSGEIDLLMASEFMQLSQTNYHENSGLKINILLSTPMESYFGFNKNEKELSSLISKIMHYIDTYSIERSWTTRYFDYHKKEATERMYYFMVFSAALLVLLLLVMFLLLKNKRMSDNLARLVAERTSDFERQNATLTTIYESIPDILFTMDTNLVYTSCNPSFEEFVGAPRSNIIGKTVDEILGSKDWAKYFAGSNQSVINSAEPVIVEEDLFYPDGTPATFETIKTPLFQNGKLIGMLGVARNITERKAADNRTKLMLDTTPLACNLVDRDFNIIDANKEAAILFGLKDKEEYIERFWEIFPERQPDGRLSREKSREMVDTAFREGRVVFEWMHRMPDDDTHMPAELTLIHTRYSNTDVITGYIRDLREHKKMLGEIEHKDSLLQTLNNVASILLQAEIEDFDNELWHCMGKMAEAVNVDRVYIWKNYIEDGLLYCTQINEWSENAEPQQGKDTTIKIAYNEVAPSWEEILSGGGCINSIVRNLPPEEQAVLKPQGILSILVTPVFIRDAFWGFVGFDDCRHERKFSEDEVAVLRSGSIMIASALLRNEMTVDIHNAVEAAQEASRAKSNFLSNMSHEIRTPLNAITGMTAIGKSAPDATKKDYALSKIEDASIHLLGVVNDILDMSKIEANKFELSYLPFDFEKMIQKVINVASMRIYEKSQEFSVYIDNNIPVGLIGDSQRLAQVITNLLSNSMKFTPEKGSIRLDARMLHETGGECEILINVADTGIGIKTSRQPFIFDSFEQSDNNTARKYGGTGLGLSISKHIVELMGGKIWLTSEQGKGSTFSFTVRVNRNPHQSMPALDAAKRNINILAVDGDTFITDYFDSIAGQLGFMCDTAGSGDDALRLINSDRRYDLFFIDCEAPVISGAELANEIKSRGVDGTVILMSSSVDWFRLEYESGSVADKIIHKPLFLSTVVNCINERFGRKCAQAQLGNPDEEVSFSGKRLLLAEDVEINREIVMSLLEDTGIEIDCAENGVEALKMFSSAPERYNLIFMDVQMPEMDGLEATRQLRSLGFPKAADIPIIAMTANVFREDIEKCKQAGMNAHLGKPLDIDEMMEMISTYI